MVRVCWDISDRSNDYHVYLEIRDGQRGYVNFDDLQFIDNLAEYLKTDTFQRIGKNMYVQTFPMLVIENNKRTHLRFKF